MMARSLFCVSMNLKEAASGRPVSGTATFTGSGSGSSAQTDVSGVVMEKCSGRTCGESGASWASSAMAHDGQECGAVRESDGIIEKSAGIDDECRGIRVKRDGVSGNRIAQDTCFSYRLRKRPEIAGRSGHGSG